MKKMKKKKKRKKNLSGDFANAKRCVPQFQLQPFTHERVPIENKPKYL